MDSNELRERVERAGMIVRAWTATDGCIEVAGAGDAEPFVGTHDEIWGYLLGWSAGRSTQGELREVLAIGIDSGDVACPSGQTMELTTHPLSMSLIVRRLGLAADCAVAFVVQDIMIGVNSTFVQAGALPGELFAIRLSDRAELWRSRDAIKISEGALRALGHSIGAQHRCEIGMTVRVVVRNVSNVPVRFRGCWIADPPPTSERATSVAGTDAVWLVR